MVPAAAPIAHAFIRRTTNPPRNHTTRKESVVYFDRHELMILSRGGRVPRAMHPPPGPLPVPLPEPREGPGRLMTLIRRLRSRRTQRPVLDTHQYLRLEFAVDDEHRPTRR
jgi:hypothetical protein